MNGICLVAGLLMAQFGDEITLRWTHSVQKSAWEEDWRAEAGQLRLVQARVRGTGAGMEPPPEALFVDGAWRYTPSLPLLPRVQLRHSSFVPPYVVCDAGLCRPMDAWLSGLPDDAIVEMAPCRPPNAGSDRR